MSALVIQLILGLLAGLLAGTIVYWLGFSRRATLVISTLVTITALAGVIWLVNRGTPLPNLQIILPSDGSDVGARALVSGSVSPVQSDVYVVVHPLLTQRWWVQGSPPVQNDGRWQMNVYIGTESVGIGESYEILAVATTGPPLIRSLRKRLVEGEQFETIPQYFAKSNLIVVKRTQ